MEYKLRNYFGVISVVAVDEEGIYDVWAPISFCGEDVTERAHEYMEWCNRQHQDSLKGLHDSHPDSYIP